MVQSQTRTNKLMHITFCFIFSNDNERAIYDTKEVVNSPSSIFHFILQLCRPPILILKVIIKKYTCMQIGSLRFCRLVVSPTWLTQCKRALQNFLFPRQKQV
jgi:hypothetical protein